MCSFRKSSSKCPRWKCVKFWGALAAQSPLLTLAVRAWVYVSNCFFLPILSVTPCVLLPNFLVTKHLFQCYWLWREHPHHDLLHRCSLSFSPPSTLLQWTEAVEKTHCGPASFPLPTIGDPGMGSSSNQSRLKDFSQSSCSVEWISAVDEWLSARLTRKQWQRICSSKRKDSRGDFISVHVQDSAKFLPLGPVSHPLGLGINAFYFLNKLK